MKKGRDILKGMVSSAGETKPELPISAAPQKTAGAVRTMGISLNRMSDAANVLRDALASGDKVIELDPSTVEPSIVKDRIDLDVDPELELLIQSIAESGQQVPILVRPHPQGGIRYQAAFGHRRLRAAAHLGKPVKAVVRELTDEQLILAQGQENGARVDLSFIERALFAQRLEQHGFSRETIAQALAVDKPETSRLLQVAGLIKPEIIIAVGPARKVGRPRWGALADKLRDPDNARRVDAALKSEAFRSVDTDAKFEMIWKAAVNNVQKTAAQGQTVRSKTGLPLAIVDRGLKATKITIRSPEFAAFISEQLPMLVKQFERKEAD